MTKRFSSKATNRKGGEMMKTLICALCLLMIAGGAFAATGTIQLYQDWNWFALPIVPLDPSPANLLQVGGVTLPLDGNLEGLDPITQGGTGYYDWDPSIFGNLLLGEGYSLNCQGYSATIQYEGLANGVPGTDGVKTDMWISLPGYDSDGNGVCDSGGWHWIGNPYAQNCPAANIMFTDGSAMKTWQEAFDLGWVTDQFLGLDGPTQSGTSVDINGWFGTDFEATHCYRFYTLVPNLAMIITAPTP